MRNVVFQILFCLMFYSGMNGQIKINSLGYRCNDPKKATLCNSEENQFAIVDVSSNTTVFKGKASNDRYQKDVDEKVRIIDFSAFKQAGEYYIKVGDLQSSAFQIHNQVYQPGFYTAMRAFYLWRCGTEVKGVHNGETFSHKACHLKDGYLHYTKKQEQVDGTGGWHDAGDYGKYTVNAGVSVGSLFMAWDHFKDKLETIDLDLPEEDSNKSYPDFLKELKYEIDFLLKMQYPDGSGKVSHKLTRKNFSGFIMPEDDQEKRYFSEWSTAATADFVAMMAMAYRYFKPYDIAYADKCLKAAKLSYQCLQNHPKQVKFVQGEFSTGGYQTKDDDDRLWADIEMWLATEEDAYLKSFEMQLSKHDKIVEINWDWGNVSSLAVFEYVLHQYHSQNSEIYKKAKACILKVADQIVENTETDVYGRSFDKYYWGCNGTVTRHTINLQIAYKLQPDQKYLNSINSIVAHIFGRNYYGRSYVTGIGIHPPMKPHARRCAADNILNPWPGYIVGGGHTATDWVDKEESYSHNEIAINWQAALVYALAAVY